MADKRYRIDTLADILAIPEDRMDDFFVELRQWADVVRSMQELFAATVEISGFQGTANAIPTHMEWIDDGKRNVTVQITTEEEK